MYTVAVSVLVRVPEVTWATYFVVAVGVTVGFCVEDVNPAGTEVQE
jgi:hypothetical protein